MKRIFTALMAATCLFAVAAPAQAAVTGSPGTELRTVQKFTAKPYKNGLRITWWSGPKSCVWLDHVRVREGRRTVVVTLYERHRTNGVCIAIAIKKATYVRLKSPLGSRKVVNGAR